MSRRVRPRQPRAGWRRRRWQGTPGRRPGYRSPARAASASTDQNRAWSGRSQRCTRSRAVRRVARARGAPRGTYVAARVPQGSCPDGQNAGPTLGGTSGTTPGLAPSLDGNILILRGIFWPGALGSSLAHRETNERGASRQTLRKKGGWRPTVTAVRTTTPQQPRRNGRKMKRLFAAIMSVAVLGALAPTVDAQSACPSEVQQAKEMFAKVAKGPEVQAPRTLAGARQDTQVQAPRGKEDVQAPRSLAGARSQVEVQALHGKEDVQAPRGKQDVQAPRGKEDVQAPRGKEDVQAPRGKQDVQAPRGKEDVQAPRGKEDVQAPRGKEDDQAPRG